MLSGAHLPNGHITSEDLRLFTAGGFRSAKLLATDHTPDDVFLIRLMAPRTEFVVRLPNSRRADGRYPGVREYAEKCAGYIQHFVAAGVYVFQLDNEPNDLDAWNQQHFGPKDYTWFMRRVIPLLRTLIPEGVKLISPPLSWSPGLWHIEGRNLYMLDEWQDAYVVAEPGLPSLLQQCDLVGANVYWMEPSEIYDPSYGHSWERLWEISGHKKVVICEYGNSLCDRKPTPPPPAEIERARVRDYPVFLKWTRGFEDVLSAHVFLIGGTPQWRKFAISPAIAGAVAPPRSRGKRPNGPVGV